MLEILGSALFTKDDQSVQYLVPARRLEVSSQRASCDWSELSKLLARKVDGIGVAAFERSSFEGGSGSDG
jgi:hypothetical protein